MKVEIKFKDKTLKHISDLLDNDVIFLSPDKIEMIVLLGDRARFQLEGKE